MMAHCARKTNMKVVVLGFYAAISFISALRLHRNKIHVNLSHRYQIMENISSLKALSPMIAFHALLLTVYMSALCIYFASSSTFPNFSLKNTIYLECIQLTPLYALTLPIAIVWTEKYIRKTVQENRQKAMELAGNEATNHYFAIFERPAGRNA
uniref:Uncharacterized protein n=1 Tax=Wuchereria bancrofti TaxID=6293 RepID=A0AAF5Q6V9_WUCBA